MTLRLRLTLAATAIFIAIGLTGAHFAREMERTLARAAPAQISLQQELADTRKEILALAPTEGKSPATVSPSRDRPAAAAEIAPPSLFANEVVSDPHVLALFRQAVRASLVFRVEAELRRLGLTPEMISDFESETVDHLVRLMELQATADANHLKTSDPDYSPLLQDETRRFQTEVSRDTGLTLPQFVPLLQQMGIDGEPSPVVRAVHFIEYIAATVQSDPLTSEQEQQLSAIITQAYPEAGDGAAFPAIDWQLIAERARGVLAPPQIRAIRSEANREELLGLAQQFVARQPAH
jgi:hypothetical protein